MASDLIFVTVIVLALAALVALSLPPAKRQQVWKRLGRKFFGWRNRDRLRADHLAERPFWYANVLVVCSDPKRQDHLTDSLLDGLAEAGFKWETLGFTMVGLNRISEAVRLCESARYPAVVLDAEYGSTREADIIMQLNPTIVLTESTSEQEMVEALLQLVRS